MFFIAEYLADVVFSNIFNGHTHHPYSASILIPMVLDNSLGWMKQQDLNTLAFSPARVLFTGPRRHRLPFWEEALWSYVDEQNSSDLILCTCNNF
jgi:hypothetical protein